MYILLPFPRQEMGCAVQSVRLIGDIRGISTFVRAGVDTYGRGDLIHFRWICVIAFLLLDMWN
jgi:hypothetical protein